MRAAVRVALPMLLDLLLVFFAFHPQFVRPQDSVAYVGDPLESVYLVAWNVHQLFRDPLHLFDANVLHPNPRSLAFTDHRLLPSLLVAPVLWATRNPVLAYNVAIALGCLLAAGAARRLARLVGADAVAAWAAGALYAFHTYQVHEGPRLNVIFHGFLPLALGELVLFLKTGARARAWRTAGLMLLQGLCANYHLLYGTLLLALVTLGALLARPRVVLRRLPALLLAAAVAALLFAPLAVPYLRAAREHGYARALPQSMGLEHYVSTLPGNWLYGAIGAEVRTQQRGPHFVGFVSLALLGLAVAAWASGRSGPESESLLPPRVWVPAALALALLFVSLSLGRNVVLWGEYLAPGPYRLLHQWVPGFQWVRIPERLGLLAMLFVALLAARGLTLIRAAGGALLATVLAGLVPLEHLSQRGQVERVPVGRRIPEVYRWLADQDVGAVVELPIRGEGLVREETLEMYFSAYHWKPLVNGYTAYPPLITRLLRRIAAQFPAEVALQAFQRIGVDTVVVHHGRSLGTELRRQVPGRGDEKEERFRRLLRLSGLDLYDALPRVVAEGRIVRQARFQGDAARVLDGTMDEVYRIVPAPARPAAAFPAGRPLREPGWSYRARAGDPSLAADGRLDTAWETVEPLAGDETFEVDFGAPLAISGVVLPLRRDSAFPTRFRIEGLDPSGNWIALARFDEGHALQLLERLLAGPASAAIGFAVEAEVSGVRLAVEAGGTSFEGWSIPELEIRVR